MIVFDQDAQAVLNTGEDIIISTDTGGAYQYTSGLSRTQGAWNANPGDHLTIGAAGVCGFNLAVDDASADFYFYSWVTILPGNGSLTLKHFDSKPLAPFDTQPFSDNILLKYLHALNADYLEDGLREAASNLPGEAAQAVGQTAILMMAFLPEAAAPFLIGSAAAVVLDFFAHVNEYIVEAMVADGTLTAQEGTFLKLVFGLRAFTDAAHGFFEGEEAIERAKSALDTFDTVGDLSTAAGEMDYGLRFNTVDQTAPSAAVVIHLQQLPQ